ncbi:MAG: TRAP transporter large permease subunit, partial [Dehalococcoidia bacterium]|nr:TRAP transporter large permease subunit [Dehalococcoidia bacterium]
MIPAQVYRPSFLALSLVLCFILYPFARRPSGRSLYVTWALALIPVGVMGFIFVEWFVQREQRWIVFLEHQWAAPLLTLLGVTALVFALYALITTPRDQINILDWALAVIAIIALSWPVIDLTAFVQRAARPNPVDLTLGAITVVLVLEATRRSVGWILPATAVVFLLYAYFGAVLDLIGLELIAHRGYELGRIIGSMYITLEGIFGVPLDVAATYIILFTIYGAVLEYSGAGKFFIDWAMAAMGRARDGAGPGRTVTVAGFLLGTVSGSGVATTVTLGSLSWPLLQKAGYDRETGGAILSAAGIGAILSPPTLGAAAFLISEFLRISYLQVLIMASIPTLLYYLSIFLMIEADSRRGGTRAITIATQPLVALSLRYGYHFTSLFAIAILMAIGMTPFFAVFWACVLAIVLSFLRRDTAMWPNRLLKALEMGGKGVVGIVATCATAGIIVGVV